MSQNPYFYIARGATTPSLDVALLDTQGRVVNLQGAAVTFRFHNQGGSLRFSQASTILNSATGTVRHAWSSGQVPSIPGVYLGRFRVTYSNQDVQEFPSNRYIEVVVT